MKVIIVGATGTIGRAVAKEIGKRHSVIIAAYKNGDVQVDITNLQSIEKMYQSINDFDAVISSTGKVHFAEFSSMSETEYQIGINDKLMGQVNLV